MRKLFLLLAISTICLITYGQCDKKITFKCNVGRGLKNGSVEQEIPIEATVSIENGKITFTGTLNGETETVAGDITEVPICEWTQYLKNGKTQYKAYMRKANEDAEKTIITIEGENGNIKLTFGSDPDRGSQLQLDVAAFTLSEDEAAKASKVEVPVNTRKIKRKAGTPKQ